MADGRGHVTLDMVSAMRVLTSDSASVVDKLVAAQTVAYFHARNAEGAIDPRSGSITQKLCRMTATAIDKDGEDEQ